jgi:hypothetical protein
MPPAVELLADAAAVCGAGAPVAAFGSTPQLLTAAALFLASSCWQAARHWDSAHNPLRPRAVVLTRSGRGRAQAQQAGGGTASSSATSSDSSSDSSSSSSACRYCGGRGRVDCLECDSKGRTNHTDRWLLGPGA